MNFTTDLMILADDQKDIHKRKVQMQVDSVESLQKQIAETQIVVHFIAAG